MGDISFDCDMGRGFITASPMIDFGQLAQLTGYAPVEDNSSALVQLSYSVKYRVHRVRQLMEVTLALLFTFGLMRALKKPAGD